MTSPQDAFDPAWTLIIPVKETRVAKTRLVTFGPDVRAELAHAFALDVVTAASRARHLARLVVVTNDVEVGDAVRGLGADVLPDLPNDGLNAAVRFAAHRVRASSGDVPVASLQADLPALRTTELDRVVEAMAASTRWFVPDADGAGTTMLAARLGSRLDPAFGASSRADHAASGADEVRLPEIPGLRRDVDSEADLWEAVALGVGPLTAQSLDRLGLRPRGQAC